MRLRFLTRAGSSPSVLELLKGALLSELFQDYRFPNDLKITSSNSLHQFGGAGSTKMPWEVVTGADQEVLTTNLFTNGERAIYSVNYCLDLFLPTRFIIVGLVCMYL
jgi:hypothetical protein